MAYTRQEFALALKDKLRNKESIKSISEWAVFILNKHKEEIDYEFKSFLYDLEAMGTALKYEFSHKELEGFADRLLAGELEIDAYNRKSTAITRKEFGLQLKEKVRQRENLYLIGQWAYKVYSENLPYIDDDFSEMLIDMNAMELGFEFELSYEELDKFADRLIVGDQYVDLYNKYKGKPKKEVLKASRKIFRRQNFGQALKEKVRAREGRIAIGRWAASHDEYELSEDPDFKKLLKQLSDMSIDSKAQLSYEELDQIADYLISWKE